MALLSALLYIDCDLSVFIPIESGFDSLLASFVSHILFTYTNMEGFSNSKSGHGSCRSA